MSDVPIPPWKRMKMTKSERQERRLANLPGGSKQTNSGRHWFSKRDVRLNGFLVEARTTGHATFSISRPEFDAITRDALRTPPGQLPGMQIDFENPSTLSLFVMRLQDHLDREQRIANLEAEIAEMKEDFRNEQGF